MRLGRLERTEQGAPSTRTRPPQKPPLAHPAHSGPPRPQKGHTYGDDGTPRTGRLPAPPTTWACWGARRPVFRSRPRPRLKQGRSSRCPAGPARPRSGRKGHCPSPQDSGADLEQGGGSRPGHRWPQKVARNRGRQTPLEAETNSDSGSGRIRVLSAGAGLQKALGTSFQAGVSCYS